MLRILVLAGGLGLAPDARLIPPAVNHPRDTTGSRPLAEVVAKHAIEVPPELRASYSGRFRASFPEGFAPGLGSGLRFLGRDDGSFRFLVITDRGPNAEAPLVEEDGAGRATKAFPSPRFAPYFGVVRLDASGAKLISATPLRGEQGDTLSGIPIAPSVTGSRVDIPLDESLAPLRYSEHGLDPEAIDMDAKGRLWLGEEYGPSILKVDARTGMIEKRYGPGAGLPTILAQRQTNRGFEGVAVTAAGRIYAIMESTLDIDGSTRKTARFIRLVELDPVTGRTRMFAYPHDVEVYEKSSDAKIGDLVAIDSHRLLLVEQGKSREGKLRNILYRIDVKRATDLTNLTVKAGPSAGLPLEYATQADLEAQGIRPVTKQRILDLRDLGWTAEKAEGLALVDGKTIAISNDNDFGLRGAMEEVDDPDPTHYGVSAQGRLSRDRAPTTGRYVLVPNGPAASVCSIWMIRLTRSLSER